MAEIIYGDIITALKVTVETPIRMQSGGRGGWEVERRRRRVNVPSLRGAIFGINLCQMMSPVLLSRPYSCKNKDFRWG